MKVNVGSTNPMKIEAVREAFSLYFDNPIVECFKIDSGVSHQPTNIREITRGAENRSRRCFGDCDYGIGIEAGVFRFNPAITNYMNFSCTMIYNGHSIVGVGFSSGFEYPLFVLEGIFEEREDVGTILSREFNRQNVGREGGAVGILSKGKYLRKELHKAEIIQALLPIINKELYER